MIDVVVAIIFDSQHRVLITQRALTQTHGGYFEFPGGKMENNESPEEALAREIYEELNIQIHDAEFFDLIEHQYEDYALRLYFYIVRQFQGLPRCCEGQLSLNWVSLSQLPLFHFPEANRPIVDKLLTF